MRAALQQKQVRLAALARPTYCCNGDELLGVGGPGRELAAVMVGADLRPCCKSPALLEVQIVSFSIGSDSNIVWDYASRVQV